jgi:hypothetical protein
MSQRIGRLPVHLPARVTFNMSQLDSTGRKFFRFKVIALADMLRCRTSGVVAYNTGAMVSGGGMQYIIPNAQKCLEKMY